MSLFHKTKAVHDPLDQYPRDRFEPVIRSSICTGERVACMRDRETGKLFEIELVRTGEDLADFCRRCGADPSSVRTVY